jgi:hypothetical protein
LLANCLSRITKEAKIVLKRTLLLKSLTNRIKLKVLHIFAKLQIIVGFKSDMFVLLRCTEVRVRRRPRMNDVFYLCIVSTKYHVEINIIIYL